MSFVQLPPQVQQGCLLRAGVKIRIIPQGWPWTPGCPLETPLFIPAQTPLPCPHPAVLLDLMHNRSPSGVVAGDYVSWGLLVFETEMVLSALGC